MKEQSSALGSLRALKAGTRVAAVFGALAALVFTVRWFGEVSGHCGVVRFYEYILGAVIIAAWLIFTAVGWKLRSSRRRGPAILGLIMVLLAAAGMAIAAVRTFRTPEPASVTETAILPAAATGGEQ
ncbi:MAG: hypothetical protein P9M08_03985 [Candidatus Erginobacter occultus]|nr:hypothetical protein [Candidatus Erginobacter occultus]